jgi:hypothetical protein
MKFKWYEVGYIAFFSLSIFFYYSLKPKFGHIGGDLVSYVACIYKSQGFNKQEVYKKTNNDLINSRIILLNDASDFNKFFGQDTKTERIETLWQRIPFFKIRILYIKLISFIANLFNFSFSFSVLLISAFFGMLSVIACCLLAKKIETSIFWGILIFTVGITRVSQLSTPDAMASFFLLLVALLYLSKNYILYSFILATLLPLIRTDYTIFAVIFSLFNYSKYKYVALIPLFSIPLTFFINKISGNLGYLHIFNAHFIDSHKSLPNECVISTNPIDYMEPYVRGFKQLLASVIPLIIFLYCLSIKLSDFNLKNKQDLIQSCCLLTIICNFMLFPNPDIRYYFACLAIVMLISIAKIHSKIGSFNIIEIYKNAFTKVTTK